jgi:transcription elongation factor GreA
MPKLRKAVPSSTRPEPDPIPFTAEAFAELQQKYDQLTQERKEVMVRLQAAREMGDLSENGAYHYAKFELGSIGRQLNRLRYLLKYGYVVTKSTSNSLVEFGSTVTLSDGKKEVTYLMVSQHESNPREGKLSTESPIGQALINKKIGDQVVVTIPAGTITYTILKIT